MSRYMDYVFHDTNGQNPAQISKTPPPVIGPSRTKVVRTSIADLLWYRQFDEVLGLGWGKVQKWESIQINENKEHTWMTLKWLEESTMLFQFVRNRWNLLILTNQDNFSIMYFWNALNVNVYRTKNIINQYRENFKSVISASAIEKFPG